MTCAWMGAESGDTGGFLGPPVGRSARANWFQYVLLVLAGRQPDELPVSPDPVPIQAQVTVEEVPNALYPRPRREGGREILDVVFPDGSKAEVGYPAELSLAKLGVRPAQGAWLDGHKDLYRQLTAPPGGPAGVAMGKPMIRKLTGKTTLWHPMSPAEGEVLLFSYGPWYLALHDEKDGMPFEQRLLWAKNLRGKVTKGGYLVLSAKPPILLARAGEGLESERVGRNSGSAGRGRRCWCSHRCRAATSSRSSSRSSSSGAVFPPRPARTGCTWRFQESAGSSSGRSTAS